MFKRIFILLTCLFLTFNFMGLIVYRDFSYSYAAFDPADIPDGYEQVNSNEKLAQSFQAYCKSRDSNITSGNILGADLRWIYGFMVKASQGLGININDIQNQLFYKYETNAGLRFYMTSTGIQFYNDLFAYLIQNEGLSVGDENVDKSLYSGEEYIDDDGNRCFVYIVTTNIASTDISYRTGVFSQYGTFLKYDSSDFITLYNQGTNAIYHINNQTYSEQVHKGPNLDSNNYYFALWWQNNTPLGSILYSDGTEWNPYRGYVTIVKNTNGRYYPCVVSYYQNNYSIKKLGPYILASSATSESVNINFVSNKINNNNYEGDTYITYEGDVINNGPAPGGNDPGWNVGGGQGSYNDGNGNSYTINFPDFELPNLNIDWSIQGLGNKFPFSIPFDIVSLVTVLNAEPEAPRFQGTVNFGFTTWDYDINLEQFNTVAQVCRIAELLLLVFGLILITRSIIKG